jgi:hypothetical protein
LPERYRLAFVVPELLAQRRAAAREAAASIARKMTKSISVAVKIEH